MNIEWKRVTWYSQVIAIVLFVGVFLFGYWLGLMYPHRPLSNTVVQTPKVIADVRYACEKGKTVRAVYREESVQLTLSDGRLLVLPHARSADGARYANADESIVFWNKGRTAFITEHDATTYGSCNQVLIPS